MTENQWYSGDPEVNLEATAAAEDTEAVQFHDNGNSGAALSLAIANGGVQKVTLTASAPTLTITDVPAAGAARLRLLLAQDGSGSRLLPTFSPAADYGTAGAPVLTTTASKTDVLECLAVNGALYVLGVYKGF